MQVCCTNKPVALNGLACDNQCRHGDDGGCVSMSLECRLGCGACCIAPSISSAIVGMPEGKPAGVRCVQLSSENLCLLFGKSERPAVCGQLQPSLEMCGTSQNHAMVWLARLEAETRP